jgi:hypothetical protein
MIGISRNLDCAIVLINHDIVIRNRTFPIFVIEYPKHTIVTNE